MIDDLIYYAAFVVLISYAGYGLMLMSEKLRDAARQARSDAAQRKILEARLSQILSEVTFGQNRRRYGWVGFRKFTIREKITETDGVCTFELAPHDGKSLQIFFPGQYLTFRFSIPGVNKPVIRCYSISDSPHTDHYRVSVKRIGSSAPDSVPGLVSSYFHDQLKPGSTVDVKAPAGQFFLDMRRISPVVLIAGGIGITPLLSMLNTIIESGSQREVWFFYGVQNSQFHIKKDYLRQLASEHKFIRLHICYSHPKEEDVQGQDYDHAERVSIDLLKRLLPSNNFEYYVCGPATMMEAIIAGLEDWGVPTTRIHFEAFGQATVQRVTETRPEGVQDTPIEVTFARSHKTVPWDPSAASLLEFAETNGIVINSGCRAGNCGTCMTTLRSGQVTYLNKAGVRLQENACLPCIAVPKSSLVLTA